MQQHTAQAVAQCQAQRQEHSDQQPGHPPLSNSGLVHPMDWSTYVFWADLSLTVPPFGDSYMPHVDPKAKTCISAPKELHPPGIYS